VIHRHYRGLTPPARRSPFTTHLSPLATRHSPLTTIMAKHFFILLLFAAVGGAVYFFLNYEIQTRREDGKPAQWIITPRTASAPSETPFDGRSTPTASARATIRVATFQLGRLDDAKLADPRTSDILAHLLAKFDLIAVQGVRGANQGTLVKLIERIGAASGRTFDYATCPTQRRDGLKHYSAFLFDPQRIEVDRTTVRFIEDRLGRFRVKPLTGLFRARGPDPAEAFTFMLIAVEADPERVDSDLELFAEAYRAVRDANRGEDDIIMLGDFQSDDRHLGPLNHLLGVSALVCGIPTTARGAHQLDNILLDRRAVQEFNGRIEVLDVMREFNLTVSETIEVSEHLPVWAEFSVYEGGELGRSQR